MEKELWNLNARYFHHSIQMLIFPCFSTLNTSYIKYFMMYSLFILGKHHIYLVERFPIVYQLPKLKVSNWKFLALKTRNFNPVSKALHLSTCQTYKVKVITVCVLCSSPSLDIKYGLYIWTLIDKSNYEYNGI